MTATAWLALADPDREHAERWLTGAGIVLLPLGRRWSAVKTTQHAGLSAAHDVSGPVIHDPTGQSVYFLVPTSTVWEALRGTELLGTDCYLTVPVVTRTEPPGPYWIRQPDGTGTLVDPAALRGALTQEAP